MPHTVLRTQQNCFWQNRLGRLLNSVDLEPISRQIGSVEVSKEMHLGLRLKGPNLVLSRMGPSASISVNNS